MTDDDLEALRDATRGFLARRFPRDAVRAAGDGPRAHDAESWRGAAGTGWGSGALPGGAGRAPVGGGLGAGAGPTGGCGPGPPKSWAARPSPARSGAAPSLRRCFRTRIPTRRARSPPDWPTAPPLPRGA